MGALIRAHNWTGSPLGPPQEWPQPLKTAVGLLLNSGYPMYIAWGKQFTQIYNDAYRPILGSTKHPRALGIGTPETFAEIWEYIGPMFAEVMSSGKASTFVDQLLPLNRHGFVEECYFVFSYSPIIDAEGGVGGVFVTVLETTERVLRERRQTTLRQLTEISTDGGREALLRAATDMTSQNSQDFGFVRLLSGGGGPSDDSDVLNVPFLLKDEVGCEAWPEHVKRAIRLPIVAPGAITPAGVLEVGLSPRLSWDPSYAAFLDAVVASLGTSIAKAEALEHERRRSQELAEIDAAKTVFFSNVSHEFRTPLTLMLSPLRDLTSRPEQLSAEALALVRVAERNAVRLLKLVNALLDFSRIEAGRVTARYEPTDIAALTVDLASNFRSAMEAGGVRLIVDCPPVGEQSFVDRDMWEKIVLNLLSNAFKFTFGGHIKVSLRKAEGGSIALAVEDTGEGIPEEELPRLFERFHRVEGVRGRSYEGTGIGLALVQELVHLHGGTVSVRSAVGEGTTFTVIIPSSPGLIESRTAPAKAQGVGPRALAFIEEAQSWLAPATSRSSVLDTDIDIVDTSQRGCVLVADDNADMRQYISNLLNKTGLQVLVANDGEAALELARRELPDVIICDVMMPRLDGLGLLAKLRADTAIARTSVILVSARAGEEETVAGVAAGADDYISKPFGARELVARVRTQLALSQLRREAGEAIEESERRMRLAQHAGRIATWEFNPQTGDFSAPLTQDLWGIDPRLGYKGFLDALHAEDRPKFEEAVQAACRADGTLDLEFRILRPDTGKVCWIACRAEYQPSVKHGARLIGISFDISEQRQAEQALRRINQTLEAEVAKRIADRDRLWKLSTDIMLVARFDGNIIDVNPAWTILLGWQAEELVGHSFFEFVHPDDIVPTQSEVAHLAAGKVTFKFENRYRRKSGDYRWLTWTATPDREFIHAVGRDITDEKRNVERLEAAEAALRQAQKMEAIGQLSGGIAHDFNNLLGAIVGSFDLIRRHPDDVARVSRLAETGLTAAERGARLTGQLLTFSRAQRIDVRPIEVSALVKEMHELITRTLGPSVVVRLDLEPGVFAQSDATQLEMAILNLAINARDAMPGGGELNIRVAEHQLLEDAELTAGSYVVLSVTDSGTGMPPEIADRALDPFFTTKGVGKGTGLGLSQAFGLAKQSGGTLRIFTAVDQGTTIEIILPRVAETSKTVTSDSRSPSTASKPCAKKVLVVDDDDQGRAMICESLRELGFEAASVCDGQQALEALSKEKPDLMLLDYAMPGLTGAEVAKQARAWFGHLPIIFVSGYSDTAALQEVSDEHMGLLRKPFRLTELQAILHAALAKM